MFLKHHEVRLGNIFSNEPRVIGCFGSLNSVSSRYSALLRLWASSVRTSQGTESFIATTCLEESDVKIKSGLTDVLAVC